jgi:cytochrome P450
VVGALVSSRPTWLPRAGGVPLLVIGAAVAVAAPTRWRAVDRAVRADQPLPPFRLPWWLSTAIAVAGLLGVLPALRARRAGTRPREIGHTVDVPPTGGSDERRSMASTPAITPATGRSERATRVDLESPVVRDNPYELYARWRASEPVRRGPIGEWYLTRYDDVLLVLGDHARFSSNLEGTQLYEEQIRRLRPDDSDAVLADESMLRADPPDHTRLRKLASKAFTPRAVERLRPRVEQIVHDLLDAVDAGSLELIGQLAYPLPVTVISELLGVPVADRELFRRWSRDLVDNPGLVIEDPELLRRSRQAIAEFDAYIRGLTADRRHQPRDDLVSALVAAEDGGDQLDEQELISTCILLLIAGHETTVNLIGNGTLALLRHPTQLRRLRDDPSLVDSAVEEMLRYDSPVQGLSRAVTQDVELRGVTLRRNDVVMPMVGAANRDPEAFPNPDEFDIGRPDNRHLSFGKGIHFCLGAPLARLEAQIAIPALLRRFPNLELRTEHPRWRPSWFLRGLEELPLAG